MSIDKSGQYWVATEASDLEDYLRELTAKGYPADRVAHAKCECGRDRFGLDADSEQGGARRVCTHCGHSHFICDSEEIWSEAEPEAVICTCGGRAFQVAVAFSHRDDASVRWVTVGHRCVNCGVLGAAVDWKIDYGPTDHLYAQA